MKSYHRASHAQLHTCLETGIRHHWRSGNQQLKGGICHVIEESDGLAHMGLDESIC